MKNSRYYNVYLSTVLLLSSIWPLANRAETIDCTAITSLPYVISNSGIYCLTDNLSTGITSGSAIDIQANNVTIDLNGWRLGGLPAGNGTQTIGINSLQRKNITIKNGTVRGFYWGILLNDSPPYTTSQGHVVENIRAEQNTFIGISVTGVGNIVRNNQIVDTADSIHNPSRYGLTIYGQGTRVLNNDIVGVAATGGGIAIGLFVESSNGAVIQRNRIHSITSETGGGRGINITSSNNIITVDNRITDINNPGTDYGIFYEGSTGKYMNNLTSNVETAFSGGTAVGTNN